jgi:hypothetical protein
VSARTWLAALTGRHPYTITPLEPAPAGDGMPPGLRPVPMAPPGTTHCMRGEICGTRHGLDGEHLVAAEPADEWAPLSRGPITAAELRALRLLTAAEEEEGS